MMGDYHVRFCERPGVKFPLTTRRHNRYLQTKQSIVNRIKKIIFILPLLFGVSINSIAQEITISTDRP
ncbi:MAG: hypothetical protein PHI70_10070, partial [Proteiniphilum sp.]|nr:hypothetical protein [Proteiniphilum sp.]